AARPARCRAELLHAKSSLDPDQLQLAIADRFRLLLRPGDEDLACSSQSDARLVARIPLRRCGRRFGARGPQDPEIPRPALGRACAEVLRTCPRKIGPL